MGLAIEPVFILVSKLVYLLFCSLCLQTSLFIYIHKQFTFINQYSVQEKMSQMCNSER